MSRRVCVVGAGSWGANHARALHGLSALAGVVEPDPATRGALADRYPDVACFEDLEAALAVDFDGFTVATPAESHAAVGEQILRRGKPVLIEKPLALDVQAARRLCELAETRRVTLMVGHLMLFHPAIRRIKQLIDQGKIGKLEYLYSNRLNLGTVRTEENILWSFAPHDISMFQYLVGAAPIQVLSRGGAFVQPHLHDTTLTFLRYPSNVIGHIFLSWLHPFKEHRLVVIGSKGMFTYEDASTDRVIRFYEKGVDWIRGEPVEREGPSELIPHDGEPPLTAELRYFVEHLDSGGVEVADGRNGVEILEILERATASLLGEAAAAPAARAAGASGFVHPSSCVDDDVEIGEGSQVWHFSHVQSGARIGRHCSIGQNAYVGSNVRIGDFVKIQNNVSVYEGVELEDYVFCGPSMVFTNVADPRSQYPQRGSDHYRRTLVRHGASIGANATIVCGHSIGRHAFVGAGAVVTADVADYALVVGVPARQTGWVCECGEVLPDLKGEGRLACPRCALEYRLAGGRLVSDVPG